MPSGPLGENGPDPLDRVGVVAGERVIEEEGRALPPGEQLQERQAQGEVELVGGGMGEGLHPDVLFGSRLQPHLGPGPGELDPVELLRHGPPEIIVEPLLESRKVLLLKLLPGLPQGFFREEVSAVEGVELGEPLPHLFDLLGDSIRRAELSGELPEPALGEEKLLLPAP